jgi:sugar phosphate isomerase/epimerase
MQLKLSRHLWGVDETWEEVFPRIKENGYSLIECPLPDEKDFSRFRNLLNQYGFDYIALIFTSGKTVDEHVQTFKSQVELAQTLQPYLINSHSGFDGWSDESSYRFFDQVLAYEEALSVPVSHETHRGRILYNPWVTSRMLNRFPSLRLCCDFSHWVCVCERLLDSEIDIIKQAAKHCIHVHARVGYEEGPQVPDPRAPEYQVHLEAHERWWKMIWDAQIERGVSFSTLTSEYGPPNYLHTMPVTQEPVANLWEICEWQNKREAKRFKSFFG